MLQLSFNQMKYFKCLLSIQKEDILTSNACRFFLFIIKWIFGIIHQVRVNVQMNVLNFRQKHGPST
jgi:hypothetical protein